MAFMSKTREEVLSKEQIYLAGVPHSSCCSVEARRTDRIMKLDN